MPRSVLDRPFTEGMVTDRPAHSLGPRHSTFAQDGFSPEGVFKQRQGWAYDGTTADVADNLAAVYRTKFILADVTQTITVDDDGQVFRHNSASAGTNLWNTTGAAAALPRAVYRDELLVCAQDGVGQLRRYSGVASVPSVSSGTGTWTSGQATITGYTFASAPTPGAFFGFPKPGTANARPIFYPRILAGTTTSVTLENVLAGSTESINSTNIPQVWGFPVACVSVYEAGTATVSTNTVTGYGTEWNSTYDRKSGDAFLILPVGSDAVLGNVDGVSSDTSMTVYMADQATKSSYRILRSMPFKDVAVHKGSLWGTGVAEFPSRVYVGPPGWDISFPPGFIPPVDPTAAFSSSNANDFLMDFIDVPSYFDGDDNIAILDSPNPLLVLKRKAVYGIYGSYPNFSVDPIHEGAGCIDIRSAQSYEEGQFWAGENGIYWYRNGQVIDLTRGRINREWRNLTRDFDYGVNDYCTLGMSQGHLVIHITTAGGTIQRTYLCDLSDGSWQSRITNFDVRYMHTSMVPGEAEKLLAVSDDRQGRVLNFAPALDGSGTAKDDAGTAPILKAYTGKNLDGSGIDRSKRMIDLAVHANLYDVSDAATSMSVDVVSEDALNDEATETTALTDIDSDTTDRIDRHYRRGVNIPGRRHQVQLSVDTVGTDDADTKVEIHQINLSWRNTRDRA